MNVARWILLIPLALLASGVANAVALVGLRLTILSPSILPESVSVGLATIVAGGVSGGALVIAGVSVAPAHKRRTAKAIAIAASVLMAVFILLYAVESHFLQAVTRITALCGVGMGYVYSTSGLERPGTSLTE